ncbi:MAG: NAD-dependent epimerase/dehydratase family protein [Anaerolineales bacterium]|nr:NAD-dependent epimerase/dehydratase family protein [Anaerolineales bacterium]
MAATILVTGASGNIGSRIVKLLLAEGWRCVRRIASWQLTALWRPA